MAGGDRKLTDDSHASDCLREHVRTCREHLFRDHNHHLCSGNQQPDRNPCNVDGYARSHSDRTSDKPRLQLPAARASAGFADCRCGRQRIAIRRRECCRPEQARLDPDIPNWSRSFPNNRHRFTRNARTLAPPGKDHSERAGYRQHSPRDPGSLAITEAPTLIATPAEVLVSYRQLASPPGAITVAVTSSGTQVEFTAAVVSPSTPWLTIGQVTRAVGDTGKTPGTVQLNINPTGLPPGAHQGSILLSSSLAQNNVTIPVVLTVAEGPRLSAQPAS